MMKEENAVFAKNLQDCLAVKGWDQQTLAKYMNVSVSSVSQWVRGIKMPRKPKLDLMAQLFNCSVSSMFEKHDKDDERGDMYATVLQLASVMKPEDLMAEIARMRWIIKNYDEPKEPRPYMYVRTKEED